MIDVFISKPNWIPDEFIAGVRTFSSFLRTAEFNGRTLGSTDYPTESPLNEVIDILKQCYGIIVLGIPQIEISEGTIKGQILKEKLYLATEWNHIEAALGYSMGMPLLVINHNEVSRGIFDRGTLNSFIYSIDMKNATWVTEDQIDGAIKNWKGKVLEYKKKLRGKSSDDQEYKSYKGVLFQKLPSGKYDDTVFCPNCKNPMFSLEDIFPFQCGKCGITTTFRRAELKKILSDLNG